MKKNVFYFSMLLLFVASFVLVSCGGNGTKSGNSEGTSSSGDQLFGKVPALAAKYKAEIAEKKDDLKKCTDMNKAFKLSKELELLEEEADTKIGELISNQDKPLVVPITQEGNKDFYKVSELSVIKADVSGLTVKADVEILKEPFPGSFLYLQAYTGENPLPDWIMISSVYGVKGEKKAGQVCQFTQRIPMSYITGATKLVAKTEEEYNARNK